mmetsp:Transcript_14086/g.12056  ORF Transcript_14086/g.12056 Transcript_14086/m.12056 type:complete len:82 (-) Transcript_14086:9-254(-)
MLCWGIAAVMMRNKMLSGYRKVVNQEQTLNRHGSMAYVALDENDDDDDDSEKSINALVRSFTQLSPTWLKDTAARFQRPLG